MVKCNESYHENQVIPLATRESLPNGRLYSLNEPLRERLAMKWLEITKDVKRSEAIGLTCSAQSDYNCGEE